MNAKVDLNTFADEVKTTIDIVEHIKKHEILTEVGNSWQGPHSKHSSEDSDSKCFSINSDENYWHCFSCGEGGDVIAYEALRLDISQVEAMKSLAHEYKIPIPDLSSYDSLSKEEKEAIEEKGKQIRIIDQILKDYENETVKNLKQEHIEYLTSRGLTEEFIDKFRIGFTPKSMKDVIEKHNRKDLIASGLFTKKLYPVLADRITIPFRKSNRPVHFLGRAFNNDEETKYISQRSAKEGVNEFAISRSFWNHGSVKSKKDDNETYQSIVIVEGTMDALLLAQEFGDDYIIISCNTVIISKEQARDLARILTGCSRRQIIVCNDSEVNGAGHKGALKTIEKLTEAIRQALIKAEGKKDNLNAEEIEKRIKSKHYYPPYMPNFKMAMLRKPPDREKIDIADYISEGRPSELKRWLESGITEDYYKKYLIDNPDRFFGEDDGSKPNTFIDKRMIDELQWEGRFYLYQSEMLYVYQDGVYIPDENMISAEIDKKLAHRSTSPIIERTIKLMQATTGYIPEGFELEENKSLVNTKSGWLDFSKTNHSEVPNPHSPYRISFAQIAAHYDKDKSCETILKFLHEVLDTKDVGEFLKLAGYIATRETKYEKAFLFSGAGGNGKSTAIKLLQSFLGTENYAVRSLHSIEEDKFAVADLFGKLANFNSDLPSRYVPDGENFKKITTGDELTGERKHKGAFKFFPECTLVFSANEIPRSSDTTYAYYRRWKFFAFDRVFTENGSQDRNLLEKLITEDELSGLLNVSWEFYNLLEADEGFQESERSKEIMSEYQADNDIVNAFCSEFLVEDPEGTILKKELYENFKLYVEQNANFRDRVSQTKFNKRLRALYGNKIMEATDHTQGNRKCWRGIEIDEIALIELDARDTTATDDGVKL